MPLARRNLQLRVDYYTDRTFMMHMSAAIARATFEHVVGEMSLEHRLFHEQINRDSEEWY